MTSKIIFRLASSALSLGALVALSNDLDRRVFDMVTFGYGRVD